MFTFSFSCFYAKNKFNSQILTVMKQVFYSEITHAEMIDFEAWSSAHDTHETILKAGKIGELADLINEIFPDGAEETQINDFLWFDADFIFEHLGIENDD